jgi:hypothetical protein
VTQFAEGVKSGEVQLEHPTEHGRNGAKIVTFVNGAKAVVKERFFGDKVFRGVPKRFDHLNEVAAYQLDQRLFRFNLVPETLLTKHNGTTASAQEFHKGATAPDISPGVFNSDDPNWKSKIAKFFCQVDPDRLAQVVVFDLVLNNTDRHGRNLLFTKGKDGLVSGGRVWAIDNGGIFGQDLKYYRNVYHKYLFRNNFPFHSSLFDLLHSFKLEDFEAILKPLYGDSRFAEDCMARTRWIIRHRRHLAFKIVSEGHFDKNDFPSHKEELDALRHTRGLVADEGVFGASDAA